MYNRQLLVRIYSVLKCRVLVSNRYICFPQVLIGHEGVILYSKVIYTCPLFQTHFKRTTIKTVCVRVSGGERIEMFMKSFFP